MKYKTKVLTTALLMLCLSLLSSSCPVYAAKVTLTPKKITLTRGDTYQLQAVAGQEPAVVSGWKSTNRKVAKVDKTGLVTAVKKGTATLKAKVGKKWYSAKVTVKNPPDRLSVDLTRTDKSQIRIAIDAGHQAKGNTGKEPVGPGAKAKKAKVTSGTLGRYSHLPEYKLNLVLAKKLKGLLEARGYTVIMIRETDQVNISNSKRCLMAKEAGADLLIHIHGNGHTNKSLRGIGTICQKKNNPYQSHYADSKDLAACLLKETVAATGARKRGVSQRNDLTGINWSDMPTAFIEVGFMTNKAEDLKLATGSYQDKLAKGMGAGIEAYAETHYPNAFVTVEESAENETGEK